MMLKVNVRYFGQFRDFTGKRDEALEVEAGITVEEIREHVRGIYAKIAAKEEVLVAVNGSFGSLDQVIKEWDEVAFFPPVSGG
ncbi:molybdopterin converting factor subunit 1 [Candidatus Bathyarchaeota archaeon]|nr:molybdopterin converting factor subunit 1 [Candidatus Bathyarchaeota archaeon]